MYGNIDYIYIYIYEILIKFTKPYSFDVLGYFSRVYTKNLDVWGFVMAYVSLCDNARNIKYNIYNDIVKNNMKSLLDILLEYSDKPIDIYKVKTTILEFNKKIKPKMKKGGTRKKRS